MFSEAFSSSNSVTLVGFDIMIVVSVRFYFGSKEQLHMGGSCHVAGFNLRTFHMLAYKVLTTLSDGCKYYHHAYFIGRKIRHREAK